MEDAANHYIYYETDFHFYNHHHMYIPQNFENIHETIVGKRKNYR